MRMLDKAFSEDYDVGMENTTELAKAGTDLLEQARAFKLGRPEDFLEADARAKGCQALEKKIEEAHKPSVDAANAAVKAARELRDGHLKPVKEARAWYLNLMTAYKNEQDRLRRVAEAEVLRVAEEARVKAEAERKAAVEAQRLEAERLKAQAEAARALDPEVAKVLEEKADQTAGEAAALNLAPVVVPEAKPVVLPPAAPKIAGTSYRKVWEAEITDPMALVGAVARGEAPLGCLEPVLGALVKFKGAFPEKEVPGVRFTQREVPVQRGSR